MKLSLAEPRLLKDSVAIISELVTEAQFKITKNAMELVAMDPANVAMVIYKLLSSAFVEYNVTEEVTLGVNLNDLKQILRRAKATDAITLEVADNKLKIVYKGANTRTFHLPIIDLEEKEQKIPDLKFSAEIHTASAVLNEAIEDVGIIGESVTLMAEPKKFTIYGASETSKANIEVKEDQETKISVKEKVKSKYSVEYMKEMIQGSKLAEKVVVKFSNDYPLRLDYTLVNKLQLSFILAPRVDND
jgi:proliferating cell nuclear antigen